MNAPIGVFDSGVGGLTVAREIMRQLPEESMIYFGDTARVPYGTKSKDTIVRYSRQIVNFLLSKGVKAVVIACNTASADVYKRQVHCRNGILKCRTWNRTFYGSCIRCSL